MGKSALELLEVIDESLDMNSDTGPNAIPALSGELTRWEEGDNLNILSLDDGKIVLKVHESKGKDADSFGYSLSEVWMAVKGDPIRAKRLQNKRLLLENFDFHKVELNGKTQLKTAIVLEAEPTEGREYPRVLFEDQTFGSIVEPKNIKGLYKDSDRVQVIEGEDGYVHIIDKWHV